MVVNIFVIIMGLIVLILIFFLKICKKRDDETARQQQAGIANARQDSDVWNISGHVTGQGDRWPTHDHHLSMDSFVYPDGINKEYGCAPPPYTKVDLPTYEEAICAMESHKATTITVPVHGSTPTITSPIQQV